MPDLDQIKQGEQGVRDRRGRFARGRSGNPAILYALPRIVIFFALLRLYRGRPEYEGRKG